VHRLGLPLHQRGWRELSAAFTSLELVQVGEADLHVLLALYRQCEDFLALGPESTASAEMVLADLRHSRESGGQYLGVLADGSLAGLVDYVPSGHDGKPDEAYIALLMLAPANRGRGIGSAVVAKVEAAAKTVGAATASAAGPASVGCSVQVNNPQALRFWQRLGYAIVAGPELQPDGTTVFHLNKALR
jgi:ribosomal protein S18 acetylase RimI-like enzyme